MCRMGQRPEVWGVYEVRAFLGLSYQRTLELLDRPDWPEPLARLRCGRIYLADEIRAYVDTWDRSAGRPRKDPNVGNEEDR